MLLTTYSIIGVTIVHFWIIIRDTSVISFSNKQKGRRPEYWENWVLTYLRIIHTRHWKLTCFQQEEIPCGTCCPLPASQVSVTCCSQDSSVESVLVKGEISLLLMVEIGTLKVRSGLGCSVNCETFSIEQIDQVVRRFWVNGIIPGIFLRETYKSWVQRRNSKSGGCDLEF